jgi:hypothetical protein
MISPPIFVRRALGWRRATEQLDITLAAGPASLARARRADIGDSGELIHPIMFGDVFVDLEIRREHCFHMDRSPYHDRHLIIAEGRSPTRWVD